MSKDPTKSQNVSMYLTQEAAGGLSAGVVGTGEEWYEQTIMKKCLIDRTLWSKLGWSLSDTVWDSPLFSRQSLDTR